MMVAQISHAVFYGAQVSRFTELPEAHGIVENEACAADEVARVRIVDSAVVTEEMKEPAAGIDGARMIKRHRVADVIEQKFAATEIRHAVTALSRVRFLLWATAAARRRTACMPRILLRPPSEDGFASLKRHGSSR